MAVRNQSQPSRGGLPTWLMGIIPLLLLALLIVLFFTANPLSFFSGAFPPLEDLTVQQVLFPEENQIELSVINGGPDPVTIAQVLVDDAYWQFSIEPASTLSRLETATIHLNYPWVDGEPLPIVLVTSTGVTFDAEVDVAVLSPQTNFTTFIVYGLLGIYVGVIPVALGMLWYPFMRRVERKWTYAFLALTIGLLIFLFADTVLEALEIAAELPGIFQGVPLILFGILLTLLVLLVVGRRGRGNSPLGLATLIAIGIGLHNLGEGLAIGAAFATGLAALGTFLVVGFTLHNITEGIGIVAPLMAGERPPLRTFVWLAILAGAPAMLGTWIGGFAFNPLLAVIFLSIGAGAILQVVWEVGQLLARQSRADGATAYSWLNLASLLAGILIMYLTAFLVKF